MIELTGILLAGGKSRRLGRDKAQELVGGRRIIDRVLHSLRQVTKFQTVVVDRFERIEELNIDTQINFVVDAYSISGALGGRYSGLQQSSTSWSVLVACDMPFLSANLFEFMFAKTLDGDFDVVIPRVEGRLQTTHALYNSSCLEPINARLKDGLLKMDGYFDNVNVCEISQDEIFKIEGAESSFFNVNTGEDLELALQMDKNTYGD